jgi:glycosyltransferase involved in cell wall biosynthesis
MISVIIPTFNEEKYLEPTLKALRNQSYRKKFEIIVADGGSKDRTVRIARRYADKVVVTGRGISRGRNAGALASKGDILVFIDADTIPHFNALEEFEKAVGKRGVVAATCIAIPISPRIDDFAIYWAINNYEKMTIRAKSPHLFGWAFACRRAAFEKVGGFDESIEVGEDVDLSRRIAKVGKVRFVEETMVMTSARRFVNQGRAKALGKHLKYTFRELLTNSMIKMAEYGTYR